jgi:tape measure domain-containing protein
MSGVKIRVRADAAQASREIGKLEKSVVSLDKRATAVSKSFRNLAVGITAAFTGGALTKSITRSADSMTDFGNRVNLVTRDVQKTKVVMDELFKIAARSRGSVDAAAETFNRFGLALQDANKPVGELLKVTEAVQKAAVISGSGAQSAKAAIVQLGQGLASGQLRGQELNSVLEQMPRLAKAIADGMGIPFGKLREEAMAGKITAEAVYKAILEGAQEIDDEYNTLNATVSGLATVFGNEWTRAIANLDKAIGTSEGIADGIRFATIAVKSFGENIIGFSVLVGGELLLAKLKVQRFARDIGGFVTGIFTGDINGKDMADSIVKGFNSAKKTLGDKTSIAIKFSAKKIDLLAEMLPSMDTAKATIKTFTTAVADLFKGLWKAVVGDSYWTGIFDPSHM